MRHKLQFIMLLFMALGMASCSDSEDSPIDDAKETTATVSGKAEKGPMVRGSSVELRTLKSDLSATGNSFAAEIENNTGDFNFGKITMSSQYAKLTVNGYFFNEVSGELSASTINLDAIVDLSDKSTINVNVLTHLKSRRIITLVDGGKSFKEANEQAQKELLTAFALQAYSLKDASQFSIIGGDDAAGALIAVSSLILSDRSEAEIVEYLSKLTNEFAKSGAFSDDTKEQLRKTRNYLNDKLDNIADNIISRYEELGYSVSVKDLAYYFDWDNDGIAGNELDSNFSVDKTEIEVPCEGGDYTITVNSSKPYYLERPDVDSNGDTTLDTTPDTFTEETWFSSGGALYDQEVPNKNIELTKNLDGNNIVLHVAPAQFKPQKQISFDIYNARGIVVSTITIVQDGNPNLVVDMPGLGEGGISVVNGFFASYAEAFHYLWDTETDYLNQSSFVALSPNDSKISNMWSRFYTAVNRILTLKNADAQGYNVFQELCDVHLAVAYIPLIAYWDAVPYIYEYGQYESYNYIMPRTSKSEIISDLTAKLQNAMDVAEEKKYDSNSGDGNIFFFSKDVVRLFLAKLYMEGGNYSSAQPLIEKVVTNGNYSLTNGADIDYDFDNECILGFNYSMTRATISRSNQPCLDYKDALLDLAECYYHNGNESKAKTYLNMVCNAKELSTSETSVLRGIADVRKKIVSPYYLPFIRRNQLGETYLGMTSAQTYQLLFPIPDSELITNPSMTQNPGY